MKKTTISLLGLMSALNVQAQAISVNTDLSMLALQTYNIGAEMTIGNCSTLGLSLFTNNHPYWDKDTKMTGVQPEYRYYFGGRPMYHHFVGVSALAADYDMKWGSTRYDGFAAGAGLTFGYVLTLGRRWTIDAHAGLGVVMFHQKKIKDGVPNFETTSGTIAANGYTGYQVMPTKIGVTLSYIIR